MTGQHVVIARDESVGVSQTSDGISRELAGDVRLPDLRYSSSTVWYVPILEGSRAPTGTEDLRVLCALPPTHQHHMPHGPTRSPA